MTTTEWTAGPIPSPFRRDQDIQEQQGPEESLDRDVERPAILVDDIVEPEHELPAAVEDDATPAWSLSEEWSPTEGMQGRSLEEEDEPDPRFEGLTYVEPEYAEPEYQAPEFTEPEDKGLAEAARSDLVDEISFEENTELDPVLFDVEGDEFELDVSPYDRELTELVERQAPEVLAGVDVPALPELEKPRPGADQERCRERWFTFHDALPKAIQDALAGRQFPLAVGLAIHHGLRDITDLTEMVFLAWYGRERGYCRLRKNEDAYIQIWRDIRKTMVRPRLALPSPPIPQRGGVACVSRGERRLAVPKPDRGGVDLTGRYEQHTGGTQARPANPAFTLRVNQAGRHLECVLSAVLPARERAKSRDVYRLFGDLQADGSFSLFNRTKPDWYGRLRRNERTKQLVVDGAGLVGGATADPLRLVAAGPTLMEQGLASLPAGNELVRRYEWYPLTQPQLAHLFEHLRAERVQPFLERYFSVEAGSRVTQREALNKAALHLERYLREVFADPRYGIHPIDVPLARFYARMLLTANQWTFKRSQRSELDWIQIMLCVVARDEGWGRLELIRKYLGISDQVCRRAAAGDGEHQYKVTLQVSGVAPFIHVYRGTVTIEKTSQPRWPKPEVFDITYGGLSAVPTFKVEEALTGTASSHFEWQPPDFPGTIMMAGGEASYGVSAQAGFMHIHGSGYLPTLEVLFASAGLDPGAVKPELKPSVNLSGSWGKIHPKPIPVVDYTTSTVKTDYTVTYRLTEDAHFCLDSALLTEDARQALRIMCANELVALMSPASRLTILGHTDRSAAKDYNLTLSALRAENTYQAIQDILGDKLRIHQAQVLRSGRGESLAEKDGRPDGERNPKYRRVDVILNARLVLTLKAE
jgi:outer membrane protein OmpA-like peptidoglycan-associated protein